MREFKIHTLNAYSHVLLEVMQEELDLSGSEMRNEILALHKNTVEELNALGVNYNDLRNALTPAARRSEVAYIFYTQDIENVNYGQAIAEYWLPILKRDGPEKTTVHTGDFIGVPNNLAWRWIEELLISDKALVRQPSDTYFIVYLSNLSDVQLKAIHSSLNDTCTFYAGYIDCTVANRFKSVLSLPQIGVKTHNTFITPADEDGIANLTGLPLLEEGFESVGINIESYGMFLTSKIDKRPLDWADNDSSIGLQVLGGSGQPVSTMKLHISEPKLDYIKDGPHRDSFDKAQLRGLDHVAVTEAIKKSLRFSLMYDIRFILGSTNGIPNPDNDAMMFSTQIEVPDTEGNIKRYQVGIKYRFSTHSGELMTFF